MIEIIARILSPTAFHDGARYSSAAARGAEQQRALRQATRVLQAMRNPTDHMIRASSAGLGAQEDTLSVDPLRIWQLMLDAALDDRDRVAL